MLPGPDLVLACPRCAAPARLATLASGNTFGATLWSDGWLDAPMLPETPAVTRCPACEAIFWIEDAEQLGEWDGFGTFGDPDPAPNAWQRAPVLASLDIEGLAEAIVLAGEGPRERLLHLRIRLWQRLNDGCRKNPPVPFPVGEPGGQLFLHNLEQLEAMLDPADGDEHLLKAEACRQRGRFAEALALLEDDVPAHQGVARQMRELALRGERGVARLDMG